MSNSTPTTDEVRKNYAYTRAGDRIHRTQEYFKAFDRWLAAHDAEVLRAAAERMHQVSEVGNMFGGYDCLCGDPWLDTLGGCGEARRMRDEAERITNHTVRAQEGDR